MTSTTEIPWTENGLDETWWTEQGKIVKATKEQVRFACCFHAGWTATASARAAGFQASEENMRQSGHRAAHSSAVVSLLSLAHAQTGAGPSGDVDLQEAKSILSRLARQSDPSTRIRSLELLVRIDEREKERDRQQESPTDIYAELAALNNISPALAKVYAKQRGIKYAND